MLTTFRVFLNEFKCNVLNSVSLLQLIRASIEGVICNNKKYSANCSSLDAFNIGNHEKNISMCAVLCNDDKSILFMLSHY